jgi:hypothetical protein
MNAARKLRQAAASLQASPVEYVARSSGSNNTNYLTDPVFPQVITSSILSGDYCLFHFGFSSLGGTSLGLTGDVTDVEVIFNHPGTTDGTQGYGIIFFKATQDNPSVTVTSSESLRFRGYAYRYLVFRSSVPLVFADSGSPQYATANNSNNPQPPSAGDPNALLYVTTAFMSEVNYGLSGVTQISGYLPSTTGAGANGYTDGPVTIAEGFRITKDTSTSPGAFAPIATNTHTSWFAFNLPFKEA